jgi:hypothetical protein
MGNDNNHNKEPEALEQAERELQATLERADLDNVYTTPQGTDNVRTLMEPGDDVISLLMRGDLPIDDAFAWAITTRIKKCRRHNDKEGEQQILVFLAAKIGQAARRANLVSDTIIGEKQHTRGRGIGEWIREKAGLGDKGADI